MRLKLLTLTLSSMVAVLALASSSVQAQDVDPMEAQTQSFVDDSQGGFGNVVNDAIETALGNFGGLGNLWGGIGDFLGGLPRTASTLLEDLLGGFGVPDLQAVDQAIEDDNRLGGSGSEAGALARALESPAGSNADTGRYSVGRDQSHEAQRATAVGVAQSSTLNEAAQAQMVQQATQAQQSLSGSQAAAQRSAQSDVSQDILRNLSEQSSLAAELAAQQVAQGQQAQVDRAMGNLLAAQQARALEQQNSLARRERIASGNRAIEQVGTMTMPGGFSLGTTGSGSEADGNPALPQQ
ncbi:hypothetical protein GFS31_40820 (plasmid) [Leptolyngbya sp. BL0902]|uniref:hypothetical protein n=1 Tax=Leptolyngbya sp. BL0902 TaxID=1115757 RepID=UPI0018E80D94|nr:hypothetical protein [Leptolyngbya sp. BL0902]QQE67369.1 hypothetical protein GFS31_40820 [Leptolyngbya sp. BL0902]